VTSLRKTGFGSPLAQLIHALNQPLTGLQCSIEVALVNPRTPDELVRCLREALELTERMRTLVEAIREVVDLREEKNLEPEAIELKTLLREILDDLEPAAETLGVRIAFDCSTDLSVVVSAARRRLAGMVFRLLESALSSAARGSTVRIEAAGGLPENRILIRWRAVSQISAFSRPELGLLVAQAEWEGAGAHWERERTENLEKVTLRLSAFASN
jgi:signal transduction histidine kinase